MAIIMYVNIDLQFLGRVAKQWISKKDTNKGILIRRSCQEEHVLQESIY